jgi:hypothetical protein
MKKNLLNVFLLSLSISGATIFLNACGSKSEKGSADEQKKEICPCSQVHEGVDANAKPDGISTYQSKIFTGTCEDLDQHSVATFHQEFVNGKLVAHYHRKRVGQTYVTYDSLTWESGSPYNGFRTTDEGRAGVVYINSVKEFKDGKCIFDGKIDFGPNRFYYYDYVDRTRNFDFEGTGEFKADLITFLEQVETKNPRFKFSVE